jgi:hypothetical protein
MTFQDNLPSLSYIGKGEFSQLRRILTDIILKTDLNLKGWFDDIGNSIFEVFLANSQIYHQKQLPH